MRESDLRRRISVLFADDARPDPAEARRERVRDQVDFRLGLLVGMTGLGPIGEQEGDAADPASPGEAKVTTRRKTG